MVGIASKNTKASIKEYKKQKHYNEWEFVYDPVEDIPHVDQMAAAGDGLAGKKPDRDLLLIVGGDRHGPGRVRLAGSK